MHRKLPNLNGHFQNAPHAVRIELYLNVAFQFTGHKFFDQIAPKATMGGADDRRAARFPPLHFDRFSVVRD